jgi:hypothetical protein
VCNFDPQTWTSFLEWCKKIELHLHSGQLFKLEALKEDLFLLLPAFWHGMFPDERQGNIDLINKEGFSTAVRARARKNDKKRSTSGGFNVVPHHRINYAWTC